MCKITAPEQEPRRGFKFSSQDAKGSIDTSPEGRILSSIESEAYRSRDQRRPFDFDSPPPDIDMRQVTPKSPPRDMRMEGFSTANVPSNALQILRGREDAQRGMPSAATAQQILRGREESQRGLPTLRMGQDDITAMAMSQPNIPSVPILKPNMNISMPVQKPDRRSGVTSLDFTDIPNYKRFEPTSSGVPEFDQDNEGMDMNDLMAQFGEDELTSIAMQAQQAASQEVNAPKQDFSFSSAVPVEKLPDLYKQSTLENIQKRQDSKQDTNRVFEFLKNLFRRKYTTESAGFEEIGGGEKFPPSSVSRTFRFNNGGIVGLRRGGNGFTTNLKAKERDDAFIESQYDNMPVKYTGDQFDTSNVDEMRGIQQAKEQQRLERMQNLQSGFESAFNVNVPNDPFKAMQARIDHPLYQDFLKSQDSMFAGAVNKLGKFMGYDDPFELYKATQAQVKTNKALADARNKDRDRALAESMLQTQQPFDPCPEGFTYDSVEQKCVPIEDVENELGQEFVRNPEAFTGDPNMYGRVGGEYQFFTEVPGLIKAANGIPRGPTGEIRGLGGPKDDLVGPFMLSDQEYVLPKEMVMATGGGNYDTGIKKLENMRKDSLNKYGDFV